MSDNQNTNNNNNMTKILMVLVILLMFLIIGLLVFIIVRPSNQMVAGSAPRKDPTAQTGELKDKTREEIIEELNKIVESGYFNVQINTDINLHDGNSEADVRIQNDASNNFDMGVRIYLKGTGDTVYQSGVIERGQFIQDTKFDVPLAKGEYEAIAEFTAYDPATLSEQGKSNVEVRITVLN